MGVSGQEETVYEMLFSKTYKLSEICSSKLAKNDMQALNLNWFFQTA